MSTVAPFWRALPIAVVDDVPYVRRGPGQSCLLLRGGDERLDGPRHRVGAALNRDERLAVLVRRPVATKHQLRFAADPRERGTELVRQLGREPLLVSEAGGDLLQQVVEGRRKARELVVRLADVEAAIEIGRAPRDGVGGHARDRLECAPEHPAREQRDGPEQEPGEDQGADEGGRARCPRTGRATRPRRPSQSACRSRPPAARRGASARPRSSPAPGRAPAPGLRPTSSARRVSAPRAAARRRRPTPAPAAFPGRRPRGRRADLRGHRATRAPPAPALVPARWRWPRDGARAAA